MSERKGMIPIGTIICLTRGEYSSFRVVDHYRVVKAFTPLKLGKEARAAVKRREYKSGDPYFDSEEFLESYLRAHYLEPVTDGIYELHLGDLI